MYTSISQRLKPFHRPTLQLREAEVEVHEKTAPMGKHPTPDSANGE